MGFHFPHTIERVLTLKTNLFRSWLSSAQPLAFNIKFEPKRAREIDLLELYCTQG